MEEEAAAAYDYAACQALGRAARLNFPYEGVHASC